MSTTLTELEKKQMAQAEEILFSGEEKQGFCKELFFGGFRQESIFPFPELSESEQAVGDKAVKEVREFCQQHIDARKIDRDAMIPDSVVHGLGDLGVLGMTIATQYGGAGMSQQNYCRVMEVIGGHCGSTCVFVNAHHSIGLRGLEFFGTDEQKEKWMGPLMTGRKLAAFALTEPLAGSDAGNVRTRAEPTADGTAFVINGEKRWITNGGIADCLTVMARTPDSAEPDGKITAFLVTPDMPGFEVVEERMEKVGIRGTATGRLKFTDMVVPRENMLGAQGKGLRVALTVLDFGRTTFGAGCTGAARYCLEQMVSRANDRIQFGKTLGQFELVQQKIAEAAADTYAMEAATRHTAALIDSDADDYMIETAMLKVFASDQLWKIVNDCLQIWGGKGFFTDEPFERMMRDARLNQIGEGANDVLRCFIAAVGLRYLGKEMESIQQNAFKKPWEAIKLAPSRPKVPVKHEHLTFYGRQISKQIAAFSWACKTALVKHREGIINKQFIQARIADIATELFMASCVFSRLSTLMTNGTIEEPEKMRQFRTGTLYLRMARRRNRQRFDDLKGNFDVEMVAVAKDWLSHGFEV